MKIVEEEVYLGSALSRTRSALPELRRRIALGYKRANDLKRLWRGTGICRKRKIELLESLVGSIILYSLETHNLTSYELEVLDKAQRRLYRRALNLASPYVAGLDGLEVVLNEDLLNLTNTPSHYAWSLRVRLARARLLWQCQNADPQEPH